jgi:hypothetical protein
VSHVVEVMTAVGTGPAAAFLAQVKYGERGAWVTVGACPTVREAARAAADAYRYARGPAGDLPVATRLARARADRERDDARARLGTAALAAV